MNKNTTYWNRVNAGLCAHCACPTINSKVLCAACAERNTIKVDASRRKRINEGRCATCGQPRAENNKWFCSEHAAAQIDANARYQQRQDAKGNCRCGRIARPGFAACDACAARNAQDGRNFRARQRALKQKETGR